MERGGITLKNMNSISRNALLVFALAALVVAGGGCLSKEMVLEPRPEPEKNVGMEPSVPRLVNWRENLDISLWRSEETSGATFSLPPLFFEPNDPTSDVPEMQYSYRIEEFSSFPDNDTPWHTKSDVEEEIRYIAGGAAPKIHKNTNQLVRYSEDNVQGYFSYDCYFGDGNGVASIFTFFDDEKNRYRFEMFEVRDEWQEMEEEQFKNVCKAYLDELLNNQAPQEVKDKYEIRKLMIDSVKLI